MSTSRTRIPPRLTPRRALRNLALALFQLALMICLLFGLTIYAVANQASQRTPAEADAVLVMAPERSQELQTALELYRSGAVAAVILVGPSAPAAAVALRDREVPAEAIVLADGNYTQWQSLIAAAVPRGQRVLLVVDQPAQMLVNLKALNDHGLVPLPFPIGDQPDPLALFNGSWSYWRYLLLGLY